VPKLHPERSNRHLKSIGVFVHQPTTAFFVHDKPAPTTGYQRIDGTFPAQQISISKERRLSLKHLFASHNNNYIFL
jgi:hypothetical protein